MAFSLESERPSAVAFHLNPVRVLSAWLGAWQARRARRAALLQLLDLDVDMLEDLGIDRASVVEALRSPEAKAGPILEARRARTSRDWLTRP